MKRVRTFLNMIRFEHTVFALPFAYMGMVLAWGVWANADWWDFFWITVAMAAGRTAAMAFNRYIDRFIDASNPRTATRPIQTGAIDARSVLLWVILSLAVLGFAAWMLKAVVPPGAPQRPAIKRQKNESRQLQVDVCRSRNLEKGGSR